MRSVAFLHMVRLRSAALLLAVLLLACGAASGCSFLGGEDFRPSLEYDIDRLVAQSEEAARQAPAYSGDPSVELAGDVPAFSADEITSQSFEDYWPLDSLGRVTGAFACVGWETMPTQERGDIHEIHPTGWEQRRYSWVDGGALYNRCHLISHSLGAEDANERNLMTGTRSMNVAGMQPYEMEIVDYIRETGNHVMYRVVPVFSGDNLVADGVHLQAQSVEDGGEGVSFNVYCYNVEPGVWIDYATGENGPDGTEGDAKGPAAESVPSSKYVLNTKSMRIHRADCEAVASMSDQNKEPWDGTVREARAQGYSSCGICNP